MSDEQQPAEQTEDEQQPAEQTEEAPGWQVVDPDGNVVASGPISQAQAAAWVSEMLAEAARNEGEQ